MADGKVVTIDSLLPGETFFDFATDGHWKTFMRTNKPARKEGASGWAGFKPCVCLEDGHEYFMNGESKVTTVAVKISPLRRGE